MEGLQSASYYELIKIDGIGATMAESIRTWFDDTDNQIMLSQLKEAGLSMEAEIVNSEEKQTLTNKTLVITG